MTKSYVVDPATGKLLTAQEWKDKAGDKVTDAKMIAIVPDDGSSAFAMPVETFKLMNWKNAMAFTKDYKAPHAVDGSDGSFALPSRKQAVDIRMARENQLCELLDLIGAKNLKVEMSGKWTWTSEKYIPADMSKEESVRYASGDAWYYHYGGMSYSAGFAYELAVRPVTLLKLNS